MTQKDKNLLFQDLCGRIPYGVKCISGVNDATLIIEGINPNSNGASQIQVTYECSEINFDTKISTIKPYLFPMSSMTEEQKSEFFARFIELELKYLNGKIKHYEIVQFEIDFYNKKHLDYRGLIPKGLALDATGLNIY